jgi:hypothetical protein
VADVGDANVRVQQGLGDADDGRVAEVAREGRLEDDLRRRSTNPSSEQPSSKSR